MEMCCISSVTVMVIPGEKSNFILEFLMGPKGRGFRSLLLRDCARSQIGFIFADDRVLRCSFHSSDDHFTTRKPKTSLEN